jgi:hypothetical protein
MPICFPRRQMAWQGKDDPLAINLKYSGSSGWPVKLRHVPVADMLRTMHATALLLNSIVAGVVTACR